MRTEMKRLRKDNEEKKEIINHLLFQLNSVNRGQDYDMWMAERKEKNRIIARLMQQIAQLEKNPDDRAPLQAQIQILKCRVTKLKIEKDEANRKLAEAIAYTQSPLSESEVSRHNNSGRTSPTTTGRTSPTPTMTRPRKNSSPKVMPRGTRDDKQPARTSPPQLPRSEDESTSKALQEDRKYRSRRLSIKSSSPASPKTSSSSQSHTGDVINESRTEESSDVVPLPPQKGLPPPPPPPGKKAVARPSRSYSTKPTSKTKIFNWSTISPYKINNTIWEKADDSTVLLDSVSLEKIFCSNSAGLSKLSLKRFGTINKISLIDLTRANNIGVMLSAFKGGVTEVKAAILELNEVILTQENTTNLLQFIPTKEELQMISEFNGDVNNLGKAELYFKEIADIPRLEQRLHVHLFSMRYPELVEELRPDLRSVIQAAVSAKESKRLRRVLEIVLAVGNFLNDSTTRGNAFGYRLESLKKLKDTRGNDGTTLLHYIAQLISNKYPDLWEWEAELCHLEHAAKVSWRNINEVMKSISRGVQLVAKEIVLANDPQDKYSGLLASLSALCAGEYDELVRDASEAERAMLEVALYYGESPPAPGLPPSPDDIFGIIASFLEDLKTAKKEVQRRIAHLNSSGSSSSSSLSSFKTKSEKGGVDDLTATIRRGNIFKERRKTPSSSTFSSSAPALVVPSELAPSPVTKARTTRSHSVVESMPASAPPPSLAPTSPSLAHTLLPRSWITKK